MSDRYEDEPFLRYVDAWVLDAIGHLDEPTRAYCVAMEMVAQQMKFAPDLSAQIRKIWDDGRVKFAAAHGRPADPVQFAMTFVDRNFGRA
jgi:hypothetical protein